MALLRAEVLFKGSLSALGGLWLWDVMTQRYSLGPHSFLNSSSNYTGQVIICKKMIMTFFPLRPLLLFPEPSPAFLGGPAVILSWESGQHGLMSAWFFLPGLQISPMAPTPCLLQFRNALSGLVWIVAFGSASPPFNSSSPASLIGTNRWLQSPISGLSCGTRFILSKHMPSKGGRHHCSCWRAISHMLTERPPIPHRKWAP